LGKYFAITEKKNGIHIYESDLKGFFSFTCKKVQHVRAGKPIIVL